MALLCPSPALPFQDTCSNQMSCPQGLGNIASGAGDGQELPCFFCGRADNLRIDFAQRKYFSCILNKSHFMLLADFAQRLSHAFHIGPFPHYHNDGEFCSFMQFVNVYHIEACNCDAIQKNALELVPELGLEEHLCNL